MGKPKLNLEDSIEANSNQKSPKTAKNSVSISAFLFSIFIFISLFHLDPSTLLNDTKFWFFISNAIILILAVDSGAFSSSKQKQDLYEEILINSRSRSSASLIAESPQNCSKSVTETSIETELVKKPKIHLEREGNEETREEKRFEFVKESDAESRRNDSKFNRSNSEKTISAVVDEKEKILHRSETEKLGMKSKSENKENEFSAMPVEELNRRVEEFIQRFNRQIRLQET